MQDPVNLTSAFLLGLFSTLHCVGMCGGIIGALSLSLPVEVRRRRFRMFVYVTTYNLGRIASYTGAGIIAGAIGTGILTSTGFSQGHTLLRIAGVGMMVAVGLYLSGWVPQLRAIERIGTPVWRLLEPLGRRLLPVSSLPRAFAYGLIWGWLPCGLVYFVLIWSLTSGDALQGGLNMLAFGLGTLPTLIATGFMTSWLTRFARSSTARRVVGVIIILMAVGTFFVPMDHESGVSGHGPESLQHAHPQ